MKSLIVLYVQCWRDKISKNSVLRRTYSNPTGTCTPTGTEIGTVIQLSFRKTFASECGFVKAGWI